MKIYCFYLYDRDMTKEEYIRLKSNKFSRQEMNRLYAITNKKKYAKLFMETRNMNKFILIKQDIDEDIYVEFANKKHGVVLDMNTYRYYPKLSKNIEDSDTIQILSTYMERMQVDSQVDQSLLGFSLSINFQDPFILRKEWLEVLDLLEYINFYKIYISETLPFDDARVRPLIEYDEYPSEPMLLVDELQVFIQNFGKYMK